jgi:hypothetical protein
MSPRTEIYQLRRSYGVNRNCLRYTVVSGTIALGGMAANSALWTFFPVATGVSPVILWWLEAIRVTVTTIAPFTVPVTANRLLMLARCANGGGGGLVEAGTNVNKEDGVDIAFAQDRISTGAALTGVTPTSPFGLISLVGTGLAGAVKEYETTFGTTGANLSMLPIPGICIATRSAIDVGGSVQLAIELDYQCEAQFNLPVPP